MKLIIFSFTLIINILSGYSIQNSTLLSKNDEQIELSASQKKMTCLQGYEGENCDVLTCLTYNLCKNGKCMISMDQHVCVCNPEYYGKFCDTILCQGRRNCFNGECTIKNRAQVECVCHPGYYGKMCTNFKCDDQHPCKHGICVKDNNLNYCLCYKGFTGPRCEEITCDGVECPDDKFCGNSYSTMKHFCTYPKNYLGKNNEKLDCRERDMKCLYNGVCNTTTNKCDCRYGFKGPRCGKPDCSASNDFLCPIKRGICTKTVGGDDICICRPGFGGRNCMFRQCDGKKLCSGNHKMCNYGYNGPLCVCMPGYTGSSCSIKTCEAMKCLKGSKCIMENYIPKCICLPGYFGNRCEKYDCTAQGACINGNCTLEGNKTICKCNPGWDGPGCRLAVCKNFTKCKDGDECFIESNEHYCKCANPKNIGRYCEASECADPTYCKNGGRCFENNGVKKCICLLPFTGEKCEISNKCKDYDPCFPYGMCVENYGVKTCVCYRTDSGTFCDKRCSKYCGTGGYCQYEFLNSETEICRCKKDEYFEMCSDSDFMRPERRQFSEKIDLKVYEGNYRADCYSTGCLNGGKCFFIGHNILSCLCKPGYVGKVCEFKCPDSCELNYCYEYDGSVWCYKNKTTETKEKKHFESENFQNKEVDKKKISLQRSNMAVIILAVFTSLLVISNIILLVILNRDKLKSLIKK